jgi:preprotein translocase subunit SecB
MEMTMAEQDGNGTANAQGAPPRFSVLTQYVKDFSFENPNAPRTLAPQPNAPKIALQINVNARQLAPTDYEVALTIEGSAGEGADTMFKFEITYNGVLRLENIPGEQVQPLVMIEGPRLLFPFARQIVAEAVRSGGFPPLYVDPIDFHGLYLQRLQSGQGRA